MRGGTVPRDRATNLISSSHRVTVSHRGDLNHGPFFDSTWGFWKRSNLWRDRPRMYVVITLSTLPGITTWTNEVLLFLVAQRWHNDTEWHIVTHGRMYSECFTSQWCWCWAWLDGQVGPPKKSPNGHNVKGEVGRDHVPSMGRMGVNQHGGFLQGTPPSCGCFIPIKSYKWLIENDLGAPTNFKKRPHINQTFLSSEMNRFSTL